MSEAEAGVKNLSPVVALGEIVLDGDVEAGGGGGNRKGVGEGDGGAGKRELRDGDRDGDGGIRLGDMRVEGRSCVEGENSNADTDANQEPQDTATDTDTRQYISGWKMHMLTIG